MRWFLSLKPLNWMKQVHVTADLKTELQSFTEIFSKSSVHSHSGPAFQTATSTIIKQPIYHERLIDVMCAHISLRHRPQSSKHHNQNLLGKYPNYRFSLQGVGPDSCHKSPHAIAVLLDSHILKGCCRVPQEAAPHDTTIQWSFIWTHATVRNSTCSFRASRSQRTKKSRHLISLRAPSGLQAK